MGRSANPENIRAANFLNGGPGLRAAIDQAIIHGNEIAQVPSLNEFVTGSANLKIMKDRYEHVKGTTNSIQKGGVKGKYGQAQHGGGAPFSLFVYSSVYEGLVVSNSFARQTQDTHGISNQIEFGDRIVNRLNYEQRIIHGTQANYHYGDVPYSYFKGVASEEIVTGAKHDVHDQVMTVDVAAPANVLMGFGLHLQTRPCSELNVNLRNMVFALSDSLFSLLNLEFLVNGMAFHGFETGLSGLKASADAGNIRRILGIPVGPMRIQTPP
ncbi:MAG TPA: hypothetical protein VHZ55_02920 [Bryobacteraceae bacterium]|jgi:hypothetical protein|nr:hypothetical protein [Bryobacteraceae bacterium]